MRHSPIPEGMRLGKKDCFSAAFLRAYRMPANAGLGSRFSSKVLGFCCQNTSAEGPNPSCTAGTPSHHVLVATLRHCSPLARLSASGARHTTWFRVAGITHPLDRFRQPTFPARLEMAVGP